MEKDKKDYSFLMENEKMIIREIKDPNIFQPDSFETINVPVKIKLIVGVLKQKGEISNYLNPDKKTVQSVQFEKPDWDLDQALDWLKSNKEIFFDEDILMKKFKKDLKSISGVEIFSAGKWNGDRYTEQDLEAMVSAFNETKDHIRPFLKLGHSDKQKLLEAEGLPAAGWIGKIYRKGEKLLADFIDIPNKIYELIENKAYRKVSSEIYLGVQIKDRKYKYMVGAVALLGAETPGVMNLSDILARFGLKDYDSIKSYADNKSIVESKTYCIEDINNKKQGEPMSKTEKEMELELKLKEAQDQLKANQDEIKEFKTNLETQSEQLKEIKDAKIEAEKKAFEMERKAFETEIEKQADELLSSGLISKSMRPFAVALLKNETDQETKKYSFEIEKEKKEYDRYELIKEFASLAKKASDVNFDDNSDEGEKKALEIEDMEKVEKYASENEVSFTEAYKAVYAGKLTVERPNVEEN